ncbi:MAG: PQQ-dependent dehydrogenase, methanol/ethanol family [Polyangiales bacterium]
MKRTLHKLAAAAWLAAALPSASHAAPAVPMGGTADNWPNHAGGVDESGFSRLKQIDSQNVGKLGLAWSLVLDSEVTLEATPLAVDGQLYFTGSSGSVYAVDAISGKLTWKHDPKIWEYSPSKQRSNFGVNRGVAYDAGKIFAGVLDGRLIALDAKTGRLVWSVDTVPPDDIHTVTGAPRVFKGKVIIGNGGADANMRGYVTAYDQATGKQLWRFYTVPGSPEENKGDAALERAAKTWGTSEYWKNGTGGTVWNGITFDPELNRVYIGTGNGGPYNPEIRDPGGNGDNLYLCSIVALDADSGEYVWHYQINPREAWDYKATANMITTTLVLDGKPRKVLLQSPTNGFIYVIDRETGRPISAEKTGKVTWAERIDMQTGRPVERADIRYEKGESILYPSMIGSHNWQDMSFNPQTGLVYIPFMQLGAKYSTDVQVGEFSFGGVTPRAHKEGPEDGKGSLLAWDPVQQKARWSVPLPTIWNGGTLTTAGNLVFQGTADGKFSAYDASSGQRLWELNAGLGIVSPPISFAVKGKQYVSVLVGYGGSTAALSPIMNVGWKYGAQPRRLLTFSLDGQETLAPSPPPDMTVHALDVPGLKIDEANLEKGRMLQIYCMACHGPDFQSAGSPGPDLRESKLALSEDNVWAVLNQGLLMQRGMPRYEQLTRDQVHALYLTIRAAARQSLGLQVVEPTPTPPPPEPDNSLLAKLQGFYMMVRGAIGLAPEEEPVTAATAGAPTGYTCARTKIGKLLDDPAARAIVDKHVPGLSGRPQIGLARSMTLKQLQNYSPEFSDPVLAKIDADFAKLPPKN